MAVTSRSTALQSISRQSDGTWIRPGQAGGLLMCCVIRNDAHAMQQVCVSGLAVSSGTCDRFSTSHTGVEGPSRARLGRSTRQGSHHDRQRLRTVLRRRRTVEFAHRRADACRPSIRGRPCADGRPPRGDASRGRPLRITGRHRSGTRHADRGAAGSGGPRAREISSETKAARIADMERTGRIRLGGLVELPFSANDIGCHPRVIRPRHPNAMELRASTRGGARLPAERYYSVGGGFVVTDASPTIRRLVRTYHSATAPDDVTVRFLLAAGAIGGLIKSGASISGADVGCQGEVGSAAAMAAGALAEIRSAWWSAEAGR